MRKINKAEEIKTMTQVGKISCSFLHDLVNPITSLTLYLENMPGNQTKEITEQISKVNNDIQNFIKIIQNTVDKPNKKIILDMYETANEAISLGRHKAIRNNVSIIVVKNTDNLKIKANKLHFYQIIMNLVGNSIDAFEKIEDGRKKTISISFSENQKGVRLCVVDNGSGIPEKDLSKIFNKGFTTKNRGMGIGLHTIKNIVENELKGEIKVKSIPRKGTKFHILIPKKLIIEKNNLDLFKF